jgi:hypothetical protein
MFFSQLDSCGEAKEACDFRKEAWEKFSAEDEICILARRAAEEYITAVFILNGLEVASQRVQRCSKWFWINAKTGTFCYGFWITLTNIWNQRTQMVPFTYRIASQPGITTSIREISAKGFYLPTNDCDSSIRR